MKNVRKVVCNFLFLVGAAGLARAQGDRIIVHPQDTFSVGTATGEPVLALPLANDDGHRRYRLGSIKVTAGK
ncbi:MAG TPA: hypothetical protein VKO18_13015 [Terriglobia bacterium]|nr:hypothetical protein [Terriglobia bacterium]